MQTKETGRLFVVALIVIIAQASVGLESDKNQDIMYSSVGTSTSRIEGDVRIITLEEDVKVTQGTLEITGDNAVLERAIKPGTPAKVTMTGSPAQYRQQLDEDGSIVEGESESIHYYDEGEPVVEFIGSASLRLPNDILNCVSIKYFTESEYTETMGPCDGVSSQ
jgi:lipopolysaccharide transport protein LptA